MSLFLSIYCNIVGNQTLDAQFCFFGGEQFLLTTSKIANQRTRKVTFIYVVYTN